jgi:Na+-driven multidrug efflux pump
MATLACNLINLCLAPILIFTCGLGIQGAAAAIVIAQVRLVCMKSMVSGRRTLHCLGTRYVQPAIAASLVA